MQADLQTAAQRLPLTKRNKVSITQLEPQQSTDDILRHEITEIGTHMLVINIDFLCLFKFFLKLGLNQLLD